VRIVSDRDGNFIFDPTFAEIAQAHLDLTVAGTLDAITMVESQGKEVSNDLMVRAFAYAHDIVKELCKAQKDFVTLFQNTYEFADTPLLIHENDSILTGKIDSMLTEAMMQGFYGLGKIEFHDAVEDTFEKIKTELITEWTDGTLADPA
jgi:polyribonucleotide nucleotidyltransferase